MENALRYRFPVLRVLFLVCVVIPVVAGVFYAVTSDAKLYKSYAQFAIEDRSQQATTALGGLMTAVGLSSGEPKSIFTVEKFLQSPNALKGLEDGVGFATHYRAPHGDWALALKSDANGDERISYFRTHVSPRVSTKEQIITLEVWAFDPVVAQAIAADLLTLSEQFLNGINTRALEDQVKFSERSVTEAQNRLLDARTKLTEWRNRNGSVDPMALVQVIQGLIGSLEADLVRVEADISIMEAASSPDRFAPKIRNLEDQRAVIMSQIEAARNRLASSSDGAVSEQIDEFERLMANVEFATENLSITMSSLEASRQNVLQQQKYLLLISSPSLPSDPAFPRPFFHGLVLLVGCLVLYGIMALLYVTIRDYQRI
ncbi:hypothetical protein Q4544_15535 [Cognatishimia sp. 1_MG-2023]|uniref:hypothetical protein n=1 Tax=Cognatishimia sp. 1_MG-2023 TaxID=3062642 RepID=UPI0026E42D1F|nr:hypothetical protein [Cognatishimia sp. 1_MG-2023]MDO6728352.1 hypothetical protein [Cognatishimia sp. 1_MG-2023]